jgi:serine phosphatase RsbU (regulator of sigma subunit)
MSKRKLSRQRDASRSKTVVVRRLSASVLFFALALPVFGQTVYWANPKVFVPGGMTYSSSAAGGSIMAVGWQEIKPRSATDRTNGDIFLSMSVSRDGITWTNHERYFGPIHYTGVKEGNEPRVYSMAIDRRDRILVAVALSDHDTVILQSSDGAATFRELHRLRSAGVTGIPNLYPTGGDGLLLLMSEGGSGTTVSLAYSHSQDGLSWSDILPLASGQDRVGIPQLQPSHATLDGREFVVFQALKQRTELTSTWQIYLTYSLDDGRTWGKAVEITSLETPFGPGPLERNNQRPQIDAIGGKLFLTWERSKYGDDRNPTIWSVPLSQNGAVAGALENPVADPPAQFARKLFFHGQEYILYEDGSQRTSRIVLALKNGRLWETQPLLNTDRVNAVFPHAVVFNGSPFVFWENQPPEGSAELTDALVRLSPVSSVGPPVLSPDFPSGQLGRLDSLTVNWSPPPDPAGIRFYYYSWTWSDGARTIEKEKQKVLASEVKASTRKLDLDGTWTFSISAEDFAGNVSSVPASVSYTRDATPPRPVAFQVMGKDGNLLLSEPAADPENREANSFALNTNDFSIRWIPPGDTDIAGYTYDTTVIGGTLDEYRQSRTRIQLPPQRRVTAETSLPPFDNQDNGVVVVTVQAIDRAGNFSSPSTIALALSNYRLVTSIYRVRKYTDPQFGTVSLTISGRGFRENGKLKKIVLDRRKAPTPPWDMQFDPSSLPVVTDNSISGITLDENAKEGTYYVGLLQERETGDFMLFAREPVTFTSPGTVKLGNFEVPLPRWIVGGSPSRSIQFNSLVVVLIVAFLGVLFVLSTRKIFSVVREGAVVRAEVVALLAGRPNVEWQERKNRMQALKKKGAGLRLKFIFLTVVLVTLIVLAVSIPLGFQAVSNQRNALARGLESQANILMDALAANAETQFRLKVDGFTGSENMPSLRQAMPDATYITITGPNPQASPDLKPTDPKDFVWASDQKRFADELKVTKFLIAQETVDDELAKNVVPQLQKKVDGDGLRQFAALVRAYRTVHATQQQLRLKTDAASKAQLTAVNAQVKQALNDLDVQAKAEFVNHVTIPRFDPDRLSPTYLFYRPVIFYNGAELEADTTFYQGLIRLEVKTDTITQRINGSVLDIIKIAGLIALAAIGLGVLGAIILASITVTPIRKLALGVAKISETEDKEELEEHVIEVGTRDEIGDLADTVNEMTQGLVKAAKANKLLLEGIDVQKRFLPLKDKTGGEASIAEWEDQYVQGFGYYKGAKGVSGDYFDYMKLGDTHYAFIKCDVSGKGVAAALIMVEVATLFINYFREIDEIKDPKAKQRALNEKDLLTRLVYTINDMVEGRGFSGKFAALTICVYNTVTGVATVCNAGDTKIHIFDVEKRAMDHRALPDSPAAGIFPRFMVDMKTPFRQVLHTLASGDVLFLPTDGFEESKRPLRDADFQKIPDKEEAFGEGRIDDIVNAVFNKRLYTLVREQNPVSGEQLVFDFSSCTGTAKEAVHALLAVEKVYRMVPDPRLGKESTVKMESFLAVFLKEHFLQYARYFPHVAEEAKGFTTFSHAQEEEQYDDLTILVVKRK